MSWAEVFKAKTECGPRILEKPNVVGVALGNKTVAGTDIGEPSLVALVRQKVPAAQLRPGHRIPPFVRGVRTDVVETGDLRAAHADMSELMRRTTDRWRPAPGGVSVGHHWVSAGTLGCAVRRGTEVFLLSSNHVLANLNAAHKGDPVHQPASGDGGEEGDEVFARLEDFVPIRWKSQGPRNGLGPGGGENRVDCAIAKPAHPEDLSRKLRLLGEIEGVGMVALGETVYKSGRTTGLTEGQVTHVHASVTIDYGDGRSAVFEDQILVSQMSMAGDSGSVVMDASRRALGLLMAEGNSTTVLNKMPEVLRALNVEL